MSRTTILLFIAVYFTKVGICYPFGENNDLLSIKQIKNISAQQLCDSAYKYFNNNIESSLWFAQNAMVKFQAENNNKGIARTSLLLGDIYSLYDMYDTAIAAYYKAIYWGEENNDTIASLGYLKLANIYKEMKRNEKAKEFYTKTIEGDYHPAKLAAMANMGLFNLDAKEYKKAENYFKKALEEYLAKDTLKQINRYNIAILNMNLGIVYYQTGDIKKGLEYLNKSMIYFKQLHNYLNIAFVYNIKGDLYLKEEKYQKALENYLLSKSIADSIQIPSVIEETYYKLYEFYKKKNNYKTALEYYLSYNTIHDSLIKLNYSKEIARKEAAYKGKENIRKIKILKTRNKNIIIYNIILLISFITIAVLIIIILNHRRIKHKQEKLKIKEKNKELSEIEKISKERLERIKIVLHKKSLLIDNLKEEINKIETSKENKHLNKKLNLLRDSRILTDEDWRNYSKVFSDVYPGFWDKLNNELNLSPGETKQIVFMKLGLSQKEVANLTGISYLSVKRARQRLSKKLGLNNTKELNDFIKNI